MIYLDCFAGISGDMFLGAAVDLGVSPEELSRELKKLQLTGWKIETEKVISKGICGTRCRVELTCREEPAEEHHHRTCRDIQDMISGSELNEKVKGHALSMFRRLAEAEGKIHGVPWDQVHFHEVGAVDSIVDLTGAAVCMDLLGEDRLYASEVNAGGGYVHCAHGWFPVPAPAVLEVLRKTGIGIYSSHASRETMTPTGAVILAEYFGGRPERLIIRPDRIGYGFGSHELDIPNALRMIQDKER